MNVIFQLEKKIEGIIGDSVESPSLLHGDLWGGNYIIDENGLACLIDPAVYYGHREADLAMTKLFGGFSNEFYNSYNECLPLIEGYEYRENIYKLYHVLNHLNLFGNSYYSQAISLIKYY
jgi:fructosamine-3-kinase